MWSLCLQISSVVSGLLDQMQTLTVVPERIAKAFNISGATEAAVINISETFDKMQHTGPLHNLKFYGILGQAFGFILSFLGN